MLEFLISLFIACVLLGVFYLVRRKSKAHRLPDVEPVKPGPFMFEASAEVFRGEGVIINKHTLKENYQDMALDSVAREDLAHDYAGHWDAFIEKNTELPSDVVVTALAECCHGAEQDVYLYPQAIQVCDWGANDIWRCVAKSEIDKIIGIAKNQDQLPKLGKKINDEKVQDLKTVSKSSVSKSEVAVSTTIIGKLEKWANSDSAGEELKAAVNSMIAACKRPEGREALLNCRITYQHIDSVSSAITEIKKTRKNGEPLRCVIPMLVSGTTTARVGHYVMLGMEFNSERALTKITVANSCLDEEDKNHDLKRESNRALADQVARLCETDLDNPALNYSYCVGARQYTNKGCGVCYAINALEFVRTGKVTERELTESQERDAAHFFKGKTGAFMESLDPGVGATRSSP